MAGLSYDLDRNEMGETISISEKEREVAQRSEGPL